MRMLRIAAVLLFAVSVVLYAVVSVSDALKQDNTRPVIESILDTVELSVTDDEKNLCLGLTAYDEKDGDLTDQIMVAKVSRLSEDDTCKVEYVVFDSDNNAATLTRTVHYTDYVSPRFSLTEPLVYHVGENVRFLSRIQATDALEGDISDRIKMQNGSVSNYQIGVYPIALEVTNKLGDSSSVELSVMITEDNRFGPKIELSEYLVYVPVGGKLQPRSYIQNAWDSEGDKVSTSRVSISGNVDTDTPGSYILTYSMSDGGTMGHTYLTVSVEEEA